MRRRRDLECDDDRVAQVVSVLAEIGPGEPLPRVRVTDGPGSWVMPGLFGARPRMWISRAVVDAGSLALRGEVAHEFAHLVEPRRGRRATLTLGCALALCAFSFTAMSVPQWISAGEPPVFLLAGAWLVSLTAAAAAVWLVCRVNHAREFRADRTAARLLGSTTPVLSMLARIEADDIELPWRHRFASRLTHPDPARRCRALETWSVQFAEPVSADWMSGAASER